MIPMKLNKLLFLCTLLLSGFALADTQTIATTVPPKEGNVILVIDDVLMSSARGYKGNVVVTDKSILYMYKGRIISKINRADVSLIGTENRGRAYRLVFYTPTYDTKSLSFVGSENADKLTNALGLTNVKWDSLDGE